jgi:hypothetical protein
MLDRSGIRSGEYMPRGDRPGARPSVTHSPSFFNSLINTVNCKSVVPLDGRPPGNGHPALSGLAQDLQSEKTTPEFSWISPNNCSDAHDATCKGDNGSGDPANHQGGLFASDLFLEKWIPRIMASPALQDDGLIDITFDVAFPPYTLYGNSFGNYSGNANPALNVLTDTARSIVACCNELPGPNTTQPGDQAFGQDITPGGGVTGSVPSAGRSIQESAWAPAQQASVHPGPHPHPCSPAMPGTAQQFSPRHASRPSLTAMAATARPASGSTHHQPYRLLAIRPASTAAARYAHSRFVAEGVHGQGHARLGHEQHVRRVAQLLGRQGTDLHGQGTSG